MLLRNLGAGGAIGDTDLVVAAQHGDAESFAMLYARHYAGMRAVAVRILGPGPEGEDACQDAAITALTRIGELRDPAAARAWLHRIVRNNCKMMLRARRPIPVGVAGEHLPAPDTDDPAAVVERSAQRDWVWHAIGQLTPATRLVAMLRYFTARNTYEEIALACGTPVGTVRSRLSEARRQLTAALPRVRDADHDDVAALTVRRREEAAEILTAPRNAVSLPLVHQRWADDARFLWPDGLNTDLDYLFQVFRLDLEHGLTYRLTEVVAGPGITVWSADFLYPPDWSADLRSHQEGVDKPPSAVWLLREDQGRVTECRFSYTT
ncbi:sigma-70 family RNA polymerase sigma factor [Actinoplanes sp. NBRC 101535]|uniref:RNA polymerase sigma factor n=1 Tax=Actinoplanes sp. NBRC 101535 TaxID=3032196 RepID=UPI0024A1342F|nr:sigma-70 family RNA polymerase sigma factor [Actinoplanes sp. NBRC 101535]GLY02411.1 DNA-directed RNA polymerase sigma-70 factor [Actinoplanes sp. NBRC 101535]